MNSPSEELAEIILPLLVKDGLLLPEDAKKYKTKFAIGKMTLEDWRLAAEKALDKGENQ